MLNWYINENFSLKILKVAFLTYGLLLYIKFLLNALF